MGFNPVLVKVAWVAVAVMTVYGLLVTNGVIDMIIPGVF